MGQLSLRKAIDAKCRECIHDPKGGGGSWREQVEACTAEAWCALWPVRPLTDATRKKRADPEKAQAARQRLQARGGFRAN